MVNDLKGLMLKASGKEVKRKKDKEESLGMDIECENIHVLYWAPKTSYYRTGS